MNLRDTIQDALHPTYRLERELGGGGMSRVFLAHETTLGRQVVIKVLPPELAAGVSIERFKREIALAARLQHPHIVPVFSAGDAAGLPYFTMPFVEGESLRQRLSHGELPVNDVLRILRDVANALTHAHSHGVVHRDIKPDNILLTGRSASVTDFGVAKALRESAGTQGPLTDLGMALGTPAYMSPEQATADPATDHRTDLYAFGIVAYEMLTGHTPFAGRSSQQMLAAQVTETPPSIERVRPSVPPALSALVMRCLEKRAADRPQSAEEVLQALDALGTPSGGTMPTTAQPVARAGRKGGVAMLVTAALLVVAAGVGYRVTRGDAAPARPRLAVAPFENATGDSTLDAIGVMAADWITRGLAELDSLEVVSASAARAAYEGIGAGSAGVEPLAEFGRRTRVSRVVHGQYLRTSSGLTMQAEIIEPATGKVMQSFQPIAIDPRQPERAVEELRQRVMGAVAIADGRGGQGVPSYRHRPPKYDALRAFLSADAKWVTDPPGAQAALRHAIELDPAFASPRLALYTQATNASDWPTADSIVQSLAPFFDDADPYLKRSIETVRCQLAGNLSCVLRNTREFARQDSTIDVLYETGWAAMITNHHEESLEACRHFHEAEMIADWWQPFRNCAVSSHALGDHDTEIAYVTRGLAYVPNHAVLTRQRLAAQAALGRTGQLTAALDSFTVAWSPEQPTSPLSLYAEVQRELRAHGHVQEADAFIQKAFAWSAGRPLEETGSRRNRSTLLAELHLHAGHPDSAFALLSSLPRDTVVRAPGSRGDSTQIEFAAFMGTVLAKMGRAAAADSVAAALAADTRPYRRGKIAYARARIFAALGRAEPAIAELRAAYTQGYRWTMALHTDVAFADLRNNGAFKELVRPKK